jgi:hypothetical protein
MDSLFISLVPLSGFIFSLVQLCLVLDFEGFDGLLQFQLMFGDISRDPLVSLRRDPNPFRV